MDRKSLKRKYTVSDSKRSFKKRKLAKRVSSVNLGFSFPPKRTTTRLRYSLNVVNTVNVLDTNIIRLNSTFDPELTQTGHQPMGRDQMITLYNRYVVTKVVCDWTFMIAGATSSPFLVHLIPNNDNTAITNVQVAAESKGSTLHPVVIGEPAKFRTVYYPNQITGVSMAKYRSDDIYGAVFNSDPGEVIALHICMSDGTGGGPATGTIVCNAVLTYTTEWFDPIALGLS